MIINKIVLNGTYTELYNENLNYELITVVRAQQQHIGGQDVSSSEPFMERTFGRISLGL